MIINFIHNLRQKSEAERRRWQLLLALLATGLVLIFWGVNFIITVNNFSSQEPELVAEQTLFSLPRFNFATSNFLSEQVSRVSFGWHQLIKLVTTGSLTN